jgi:hypothetical protein
MEILSTNKPELPKKPEITIEYNSRSYESYMKNGFADNIPHSISAPHDRIQKFLSLVDLRKGPIERTVRMIVRVKAPDWNTKKHERKEFIYYTEDWDANNWLGIPITKSKVTEHIEGKYTEVLMKPKLDERTGEHIDNVYAGTRKTYYIPFSKKNVDEIIAKKIKPRIRYYDKFTKVIVNRCDICDEHLAEAPDDMQSHIDMLQELDDSYESEYDKHEPGLLLCDYCQKEYIIPGYQLT